MIKKTLSLTKFKEFKKLADAEEWGQLYYPCEYFDLFSSDPITRSLNIYCGYDHLPVNNWLRGKREAEEYLLQIASTIYNWAVLHPLPESITVYRMISNSVFYQMIEKPRFFAPQFLCDNGFMSTTLNLETFMQSAYCLEHPALNFTLKLLIPKGTIGIYVAEYVRRRSEQEILLMPNCRFQILKKRKNFCEAILCEQTRPSWAGV